MYLSKNKERKLIEMYPTTEDIEIARLLGTSVYSVVKTAEILGLKKEQLDSWSDYEINLLKEKYTNTSNHDISIQLGRSKMEIEHFAFRLGLSKSPDFFSSISVTQEEKEFVKQWKDEYTNKENGNSKGNYVLGNILRYMFPRSQIHSEYSIGGLRLDFYIPSFTLGFEVQGEQHTTFNSFHFETKEDFYRAQRRDYRKSELAEALGVAIVYVYHYEDLSITLIRAKIDEVM